VLTIRGYRATLAMHLGEILPGPAGRWFGQQLTAGVPGAFRTDTLFALMPGQQHVIFLETDPATAAEFATELSAREAGGMYRYSPPRPSAEASRMEKPLGPSERLMYERVYQSRGGPRAVLCTNNCITVPLAEFERILGTNPKVRTGEGLFDVATGKFASGESDPYMHGRARLMTEYMENPKVAGGREGLKIPMTPAASRAVGYIRVGGIVFMFYALYQTEERLRAAYGTDAFPLVLASEGFSWAGGIAGTAAGAGIASGLACMMLGPVTLACVAAGFIVTFIAGGVGALLGALVVPVSIWLAESIVDVTHSGVGRVAEGLDLIRGFGRGLTESLIVIPILTARQSVNPCNWELIGLPPRTRGDITALGLFWWSQFGRQRPNEFAAHMRQTIGSYAVPPNLLRDIAAGLSAAARAGTGWNITFTPEFIAGITPLEFVNQLHAYNLLRYRYDPRTLAELSTRR